MVDQRGFDEEWGHIESRCRLFDLLITRLVGAEKILEIFDWAEELLGKGAL